MCVVGNRRRFTGILIHPMHILVRLFDIDLHSIQFRNHMRYAYKCILFPPIYMEAVCGMCNCMMAKLFAVRSKFMLVDEYVYVFLVFFLLILIRLFFGRYMLRLSSTFNVHFRIVVFFNCLI